MAPPPLSANAAAGFQPLQDHPELASIAADLLWRSSQQNRVDDFLAHALPLVMQATSADFVALVSSDSGHWSTLANFGHVRPLPIGLLADVLDRETAAAEGRLGRRSAGAACHQRRAVVAARRLGPAERRFAPFDRSLGGVFASALDTVRRASIEQAASIGWRRFWKSPANGTKPARWSRCSSKWPKPPRGCSGRRPGQHLSLGPPQPHARRPPGTRRRQAGELRIPDNSGVVGQVVHTGAAARGPARTARQRNQSPGRSPVGLSNPHAALRAATRQQGRTVRRLRSDQQARRRIHRRRRNGADRTGQPRGRRAWRTPSSSTSC